MSSTPSASQPPPLPIDLSADDVEVLLDVADYYQRSMGFMRHVIKATTRSATRHRLRYIADESKYLRLFLLAQQGIPTDNTKTARISFTPRAAIAFWGRLLSCLNTPRSRRKLSDDVRTRRELTATKLEEAIALYAVRRPAIIETEVETRRSREQTWMRDRLDRSSSPSPS